MTLFALTLSSDAYLELFNFAKWCCILFILLSFICVAGYTANQILAERFFTSETAPPPLVIQPTAACIFFISVMALIFLQSAVCAILVLVGTAGALAENGRTARTQFGLDRVKPGQALKWSLLVFGAIMLVEAPLTEMSSRILEALQIPHPQQQSVEMFRRYSQVSEIFWFMLQAVVFSPVIEELFFRGFLLTFLKNYTSIWPAIILSGGVFAFAHLNLGAVLPLWFLGIVLGVAYEHTGSLIVPIGIHACFNLAEGLSLLLDKGGSS